MNPTTEAVLVRARNSFTDLRTAITGLPAEGLNWQPGKDTNSIAVQVAHLLKSAGFFLNAAQGRDRDMAAYLPVREGTFHSGADGPALLEMVDEFEGSLDGRLRSIDESTFADVIDWTEWGRGRVTVAWLLLGVVEHMREHVGAAALTRQLWEQRDER
jgi:hypothetical protein